MPRQPVQSKHHSFGPLLQLIGGIKSAGYQPDFSPEEGGYIPPSKSQDFWSGGKFGTQTAQYNQQLLLQQLQQQAAALRAQAEERAKVSAASDKQFQEQGNINKQFNEQNLLNLQGGGEAVERPIYGKDNAMVFPSKIQADTGANQLAATQSKAQLPGAREAAIAEQGSKRNIDLEKGLKAYQGTNTLLDNPNLTSQNMLGEGEKLQLGNVQSKLENTQKQNVLNTGFTAITPNFISDRSNNLYSATPAEKANPWGMTRNPDGSLSIGDKPAVPPHLQQIPNPAPRTNLPGSIGAPKMDIKGQIGKFTPEQGETQEMFIQRVKQELGIQ